MAKNNEKEQGKEMIGTLLDKALSKKPPKRIVEVKEEEIVLVTAWLKGEITNGQLSFAYGSKGGTGLARAAIVMKYMFSQGLINK